MLRYSLRLVPVLTLLLVLPARLLAQERSPDTGTIEEVRASIRRYDDALRRSDTAAVAQFWAPESHDDQVDCAVGRDRLQRIGPGRGGRFRRGRVGGLGGPGRSG
jgi:hypothetical protein